MPNYFEDDPTAIVVYPFDPSGLYADKKSGPSWSHSALGTTSRTSTYKEGTGCIDIEATNQGYLYIPDGSLPVNFPFKNGGSNDVFTFCFWFYMEAIKVAPNLDQTLFSKYTSFGGATGGFRIIAKYQDATHWQPWFVTTDSSGHIDAGSFVFDEGDAITYLAGRWYHICLAYRQSDRYSRWRAYDATADLTGYYDDTKTYGIAQHAETFTAGAHISTYPLTIDNDSYMDGYFDEVVIFNRFLTDEEETEIQEGVYGVPDPINHISYFIINPSLYTWDAQVDLLESTPCIISPSGCKPEAELSLVAAPEATLSMSSAPVATLTQDASPVAELECEIM